MLTEREYVALKQLNETYEAARKALDPIRYAKGGGYTPAEQAQLPTSPTNEQRSAMEVYEFITTPPARYFLYIDETKRVATTWTGEKLGSVYMGRSWRDNFGGTRVPVTVHAINGKTYHGTYYKSSGSYARVKLAKQQAA